MDDSASSATSAAHESAASRQPTAADQRLLDPRLLGSTGVSAVPSTCPRCSPHRRLRPSRSNQFVVLVLAIPGANPFSDVLLPPLRVSEEVVCKKMKRTLTRRASCLKSSLSVYSRGKPPCQRDGSWHTPTKTSSEHPSSLHPGMPGEHVRKRVPGQKQDVAFARGSPQLGRNACSSHCSFQRRRSLCLWRYAPGLVW